MSETVTPPAKSDRTNLSIDPQRLWDSLMDTARFGGTAKGGICRLTLSDDDRRVRDWFKRACEAIGCTVTVDDCGNMFARRVHQAVPQPLRIDRQIGAIGLGRRCHGLAHGTTGMLRDT
ncbi:MAG: hypothetical protein ACK5CS_06010, partial [Bradyrhizobium sp.]